MVDIRQFASGKNPRNILGIVISISVVLLVLWLIVVSRMDYSSSGRPDPAADPSTQERRDSVRVMMGKSDTAFVDEDRSTGLFFNAFTTFIVLMVLLAGVWFWSRRKTGDTKTSGFLKDIGEHTVGAGHQIKVIEINNEIWVLGVSAESVTLLHRYPKEKWVDPIPDESEQDSSSFYNLFSGKS
ncbi:flagellar biosynthetic protein FliO [Balneolales bacterium ANBcel1]|nr:flagellar biosynthetic protein FliO [Balneolales bacterium ANBcel1]